MLISDLYADAIQVLGNCDQTTVFKRMTDPARRFNNKGIADASIGEIDLCVCNGCVTLPSDVYTVLAVNNGGLPTVIRNQWFQYHINGPGVEECTPAQYTTVQGEYCTIKDPSTAVYIVAELDSAADNNSEVRVYGWDVDGKRIYTPDGSGNMQDGFYVPTIFGTPTRNPGAPAILRIDRIDKEVTKGFIKLVAVDPVTLAGHTLIGYYRPEETSPRYQRLHVKNQSWVRVKYKKKDDEIRSINDWINIDNREAFLQMLKAVKQDSLDHHDLADAAEQVAVKLMNEEATAKRPKTELSGPQILYTDWPFNQGERMFYQ